MMKEETMTDRFETFTTLINKIKRNITRLKSEEMNEFSLKSSHVNCIYYLRRHGTLTTTELCDLCYEDKAAISRSLSHLKKCGLIAYSESEGNKKYNTLIHLTESGREVSDKLSARIASVLKDSSAGLDDESRRIMYESLEIISKNLEKININ